MKTFEQLGGLNAPWFHLMEAPRSNLTDWLWAEMARRTDCAVRVVRGRKMRTVGALFNEFSAAFQFPAYFGENWNAFDECMADLSWLSASSYLVVIESAQELLASEPEAELVTFLDIMTDVASEWSQSVSEGETWQREGSPFHIVLHADPRTLPALKRRIACASPEADTLLL